MLLSQLLTTAASQNASKPAYRYLGKEMTFGDFKNWVSRLSYLYQNELGGEKSRIGLLCRNSPAVAASFLAFSNVRAVSVPIDPELAPDQVTAWIKETKVTHIAVTNDLLGRAREILQTERLRLPIIEIEKKQGGEYDTSYSPPNDNKPVDTDPILMLATSSGAKRKYALFTHQQLQHGTVSIRSLYRPRGTDRYTTQLNWAHPFGFVHGMLFPLLTGQTLVIDYGLEGKELLDFYIDSKVTRIVGLPSQMLKILMTCRDQKRSLVGITSVTISGSPVSPELCRAFQLMKIQALACYGQTENLWTIAMMEAQPELNEKAPPIARGFVGRGLPGLKYRVLNDKNEEIEGSGDRVGMLSITGPTVMSGFFEREAETKAAMRGTWLLTGDIVKLNGKDDNLQVTVLGRKEDLAFYDGKYASVEGIEAFLRAQPQVQDAAAFVLRLPDGAPYVCAAVVKRGGMPTTEKQIVEMTVGRVPDAPPLRAVVFVDALPRLRTGVVNRAQLRAAHGAMVNSA